MVSSTSARKRAGGVYEESFVNPQFEQGRKSVPQAELEHVSPVSQPQRPQDQIPQSTADIETVGTQTFKNEVSEHLHKISECLNQIFDLTSEIQLEKENVKRLLHKLHS
ncbi:MAG TPA: hypothetical protein VHP36_08170 [Chitinispirillaceae bacterium]|nr:hypothetical protein [Chitinispirillaceae bacterium]